MRELLDRRLRRKTRTETSLYKVGHGTYLVVCEHNNKLRFYGDRAGANGAAGQPDGFCPECKTAFEDLEHARRQKWAPKAAPKATGEPEECAGCGSRSTRMTFYGHEDAAEKVAVCPECRLDPEKVAEATARFEPMRRRRREAWSGPGRAERDRQKAKVVKKMKDGGGAS